MQSATLAPIQQGQRQPIVDILRGWALLGVVLMNYTDAFALGIDFKTFKPDTLSAIFMGIGGFFFAAKSWTMLSMLFGYGFSTLLQNLKSKGLNTFTFFSRRMFWLFVLAIINSAFFFGDILKDYAVMGMLLLLLIRLNLRQGFILGILLLLAAPAVVAWVATLSSVGGMERIASDLPLFQSHNPLEVLWFGLKATVKYEILSPSYSISVHVMMLGYFLIGVSAQKSGFLKQVAENKKYIKRIFWYSLGSVLVLGALAGLIQNKKWAVGNYYNLFPLVILSQMICIAAAICWLYVAGKLKAFFHSMQVIGKMTLTNYIVQNIIAVLLFSGFGLGLSVSGRIHVGYYLLFALTIYVAQVYFSKWWLQHYNYGPIEWVWRQLSYAKRLPIRKREEVVIPVEEPPADLTLGVAPIV